MAQRKRSRTPTGTLVRKRSRHKTPLQANVKKGRRMGNAVATEAAFCKGEHSFSTIVKGLRGTLREGSAAQGAMQAACRQLGIWAHLVSLVLGAILTDDTVLAHLERRASVVNAQVPLLKSLVNQVWAACACALFGPGSGRNPRDPADQPLWQAALDVLEPHLDTLRKHVPPQVRSELRDTVIADMAVELENLCNLLPARVFKIVRARLKMEAPADARDQFVSKVARAALDVALAPTDEVDAKTRLVERIKAKTPGETTVKRDAVALAMDERDKLGVLVQDTARERRGGAFVDKFGGGMHVLLLRHLRRYLLTAC